MILMNIFIPTIKIKQKSFTTFWIAPLVGAILILAFGLLDFGYFVDGLFSDRAINPIKILALFFAMTFMSIVLDEVGFFEKIAVWAAKKARGSQFKLFVILYLVTSLLTIFTSNDIIIITFTPFIIFFARRTKIDPIPYLIAEFVAANSWSLALLISNPTNIYLGSFYGVDFLEFMQVMWLPTILVGVTSFSIMIMMFKKKLSAPLDYSDSDMKIKDKFTFVFSLVILAISIVLMAVSSFANFDMWLIPVILSCLLILILLVYACFHKTIFKTIGNSFRRLPYDLVPFVIAMFAIVLAFDASGIVEKISGFLNNDFPLITYGIASFVGANLINNIPMSVLFADVASYISDPVVQLKAIYVTVAASNIGAFFTPFGALAGVMWTSILKEHNVKFSFLDFIKYSIPIAIPTMLAAILGLYLLFTFLM